MPLETTTEAPSLESFIPLAEHQAETPGTFFGGKPVLHYHSPNADIVVAKSQYLEFTALHGLQKSTNGVETAEPNGNSVDEMVTIKNVDVWVTSKDFILFSSAKGTGITISYPTIGLHALGTYDSKAAIILQLNLHDADAVNSDDDFETLDLNLIPSLSDTATNGTGEGSSPAKAIFEALSACADLHPDPESPGGEGEEEEDTAPGAGGWITSENMHEFVDADGNFIGGGALGAGAGTIRTRDDDMEDVEEGGAEVDDTKWRRTE